MANWALVARVYCLINYLQVLYYIHMSSAALCIEGFLSTTYLILNLLRTVNN